MAYEKTVWVDGTTKLNAENLNHIETGLEEVSNNVDTLADASSTYMTKSVANMLHLGAYDTYTYDSTTGKYTVTRKTTYNNDGTQSESSSSSISTLSDRYFARTGQPYIEEWKKSEADRSANLFKADLDLGTFNIANGVELTSDTRIRSTAISLTSNTYSISYSGTEKVVVYVYDTNDVFIASESFVNWISGTFVFPILGDRHVRFVFGFTDNRICTVGDLVNPMLNSGSVALPYQPYEGEVVHRNGLAEKLDKGDWREYNFTYTKDTTIPVSIPQALENGTYICQILARGTGDYSGIVICYSLGVFSVINGSEAHAGTSGYFGGNIVHCLSAIIKGTLLTVRGDLDSLQADTLYTSFIRFRKIADD